MLAVVYARVSTEEQAERGSSLEDQVATCERHARSLGATDVEVHRDVASGSVLQRPGLDALRDRVARGGVDLFVCFDPDRLARNLSHQLLLTEEFERARVSLEFVNFEWKNTPEGKLFYSLRGAIAEYEKEKIRERTTRGKVRRAQEKRLTHNPRTYGYRYCPQEKTLEVHPTAAAVVRQIFDWYVSEDVGCHGIVAKLNNMGIPSPQGVVWQRTTVRRILANTAYIGVMYLRRYDATGVKNSRRLPPAQRVRRRVRPKEEWIGVPVPPIVDLQTFEKAQERITFARRHHAGFSRAEYLLSGLVACGLCGSTLHGNLSTAHGTKRRYYVCTARSPGKANLPRCHLPFIPAGLLESIVWEGVMGWLRDPGALERDILQGTREMAGPLENALQGVKVQIEDCAEQRNRLVELYQRGLVTVEEVERRLRSLVAFLSALLARRVELEEKLARITLTTQDVNDFRAMATHILNYLEALDFDERLNIVRKLVTSVTASPDVVIVEARLSGSGEAKIGPPSSKRRERGLYAGPVPAQIPD
ncbi:MAG: recombinase family protein [Firmicutes bacterium]|nr:recombinase family protein [Bacillota bacterium]